MTVGEGIFWSTILVVSFIYIALITKHNRWLGFFKVVAVIILLGALIGVGAWLYSRYQDRPQIVTSLNSISLGMSEVDVTLAKGEPDQISDLDATPDGFRKFLIYNKIGDSYTYAILRGSKESMIVTEICDKGGYGEVLGFGVQTPINRIIEKLGEPASVSINKNGTEKLISYPRWNSAFELAQGSVMKVCVTSQPEIRYSEEYKGGQSGTNNEEIQP